MKELDTKHWPSWRYGANGQAAIFNSPEEVPEGWEDHPSKVKQEGEKAPESNPTSLPEGNLTPEEMKTGLMVKKMSDLWKMAKELGIDKGGKKPELIDRIAAKMQELANA